MIALALLAAAVIVLPAPVTGDFDGDGKPDTARLVQRVDGAGYDLVISRGAGPRIIVTHVPDAHNFYLQTGWRRAGCIEPKASTPCPVTRSTPKDFLVFGTEEASAAIATWNGQGFDIKWMSD
jgi:hypothetical protein